MPAVITYPKRLLMDIRNSAEIFPNTDHRIIAIVCSNRLGQEPPPRQRIHPPPPALAQGAVLGGGRQKGLGDDRHHSNPGEECCNDANPSDQGIPVQMMRGNSSDKHYKRFPFMATIKQLRLV